MVKPHQLGKNTRQSFAKIEEVLEMPNLLDVQKKSYQWFLDEGLREVLRDVSPITDYSGKLSIEFLDYYFEKEPKYTVEECKERDLNYARPIRVTVRLHNSETKEIQQKDVFMGYFPIMTDNGTFVINGAERVIISQICRSPGVYYACDYDKTGKRLYTSTVIPYRGAWLEYETDSEDKFWVRIDKNRKIPVSMLIRAIAHEKLNGDKALTFEDGTPLYKDEGIKKFFGENEPLVLATLAEDTCNGDAIANSDSEADEALKEIFRKLRPGEPPLVESAATVLNNMFFDPKRYDLGLVGRFKYDKKLALSSRIVGFKLAEDAVDLLTGEIVFEAGTMVTDENKSLLDEHYIPRAVVESVDEKTGEKSNVIVVSNGAVYPQTVLGYDLSEAGIKDRVPYAVLAEIVEKCGGDRDAVTAMARERIADLVPKHITKDDILASISYLICLSHNIGGIDDIDHLGNRRLRCVGELLQNQLRIGFARMDKIVKEKMNIKEDEDVTPEYLINIRPIVTSIREFFGSSPLSQFMDQNNPLAELTHKRRVSALGPGGISRDRASFDVRDVHYTHYGRLCPIETPEGQNIGLISYLSTYAKINDYGFIEAPYRKIDKETGIVTDQIEYMTADREDHFIVAQANEPLDENHRFVREKVTARHKSEIVEVENTVPDYMDVSPKMVVSVATACIPFLENDDNARALMGSNMQKQAVPLLTNDSPIVGTGMEYKAAIDSGVMVLAKEDGVVERVSADEVTVLGNSGRKTVYHLIKFKRSNQSTCINQRPIVNVGDLVKEGDVIADGPATSNGEVALGKNALIGFMTWEGYNYEDAVLLNENLVRNDVYTSIHIEEYSHEARDTKLGPEEITREVPNVGEDGLKDLDADGIIRIGTEVRSGDILVGKVTPKGETELTPEEHLLRAIFGEKAREVRDTSLRVPHGASGIVVDVKVFSRDVDSDMPTGVNKVVRVYIAQKRKISVGDKMAGRHGNKGVVSRILPPEDMPYMADGTPLDIVLNPMGVPSRMNIGQVLEVHLGIAAKRLGWKVMTPVFDGAKEADITKLFTDPRTGMYRDVVPNERLAGKNLFIEKVDENGEKSYTPAPDDILSEESKKVLDALIASKSLKIIDGKTILYDGRTGEPFDNPVTVGIMYYLKLHHLVDDKIHARSTGPYSLVTQQPLGGKAQFGGQRFGEMEVWALEAYGAAYTLQEILTVKSDDLEGRVAAYDAIVKGENIPTPGVPEAFRVLVRELQALCLDIRVLDKEGKEVNLSLVDDEKTPKIRPEDIGESVVTDDMMNGMSFENEDEDKQEYADDSFFETEDVYGDDYDYDM